MDKPNPLPPYNPNEPLEPQLAAIINVLNYVLENRDLAHESVHLEVPRGKVYILGKEIDPSELEPVE